jgi:F-type H+-transporting ATPase subunit delta
MSAGPQDRGAAEAAVPATVFDDDTPEVTRSYAEAFVNAAAKEGRADAALDELDELVDDVIRPNRDYARWLVSPSLRPAQRDRILVEAFEGRALPIVVRFLRVLNDHGRLGLLGPVARQARASWDRRQNRRPVTVRSAAPLDEGQQAALRDRLGRMLGGATPVVTWQVDPGLIGGLVVQVGDDRYDASVRSRLDQLRRRLVEGKAHEVQARRDSYSA